MIAVYILLAILALIVVVLLLNVHLIFQYDDTPRVTLRVLFVRLDGMKLVKRFSGDEQKTERSKKKKKKTREAEPAEPKPKKRGTPSDFLDFLGLITRIALRAVRELFAKLRINLKELELRLGGDDPAATAMLYGAVIQSANYLVALLQRFSHFRCRNDKLILAPGFCEGEPTFRIHLDLSIKPIYLLGIALHALIGYLQGKEEKHERNAIETGH